jgi:tetratricopeptide (TPR) repeat protein
MEAPNVRAGNRLLWSCALIVGLAAPAPLLTQDSEADSAGSRRRSSGSPGGALAFRDRPANDARRLADAVGFIDQGERALAGRNARAALRAFERAGAELGKLLLYDDPDPDAWGDLTRRLAAGSAQAHLDVGEPYLARIEALRALNVDPLDAPLQALLGTSYYREGRFAEADAAFSEALRLNPHLGAAHAGQALLELSSNHLASARQGLERAYRLDKNSEHLWFLGRVAFLERDYEAAARYLRDYLARDARLPADRRDEGRERSRVYASLKDGKGSRFRSRVTRGQLRFDVAKGDEVPLLPVRVGGRDPVYFIFDTGAQDHVLDRAFAEEIHLELSGPAGKVESAFGKVERRLGVVDSLNLNGIVIENVPFSVADLKQLGLQGRRSYYVAGVLNPALLFREFLIRVDFYRRTIELERYETGGRDYAKRRPSLRRIAVPFRFNSDGTGILVDAELGRSTGHTMLVDTGASDIYLSAASGRVLDLDPLDIRIGLGEYRKSGLRAHFLRNLEAADDGESPTRGVEVEGVLGYPFFRDMRLVFDFYHGLLLIES